ncbi:hypothetical protein O6H91_11G072600 [Diphasiastrum complanatum]|uniref:Uncharacterized protein n=1 Tax=Diphasiastrum complanatum TaxID=34168 RepID=A0ACC2CAD8_DIPCM|nr:hypothetical protein O6H91_11G072600 [Diphasiastrum complanatum]
MATDKIQDASDVHKLPPHERGELEKRAEEGETVVPGGTGGKSLDAQVRLAEGRSKGGQTRRDQIGTEGYQEMGRKGGLSTTDKSGEEAAQEKGVEIDESKYKTKE